MLKKLFGAGAATRPPIRDDVAFLGQTMVRVQSLDLFGEFAKSPNGRFLLVWSDAVPNGRGAAFAKAKAVMPSWTRAG